MDKDIFLFWNIMSGVLWSITFILLGYFFGNALIAIEMWSVRAVFFLLSLFVAIILIRLVFLKRKL